MDRQLVLAVSPDEDGLFKKIFFLLSALPFLVSYFRRCQLFFLLKENLKGFHCFW